MCGLSSRERLVERGCLAAENADRDGVQEGGRQACDSGEMAMRRRGDGVAGESGRRGTGEILLFFVKGLAGVEFFL